jgi:TonB family protein
MSNSDSKFMRDEELRVLLNKWSAPEAPGSLDQRVVASYQQTVSGMNPILSSALDPQRDNEVVKMKFCETCKEEFADRFSFCPVDGTPLSARLAESVVAPPQPKSVDIETSYPMSETQAAPIVAPVPPTVVPPSPSVETPAARVETPSAPVESQPSRLESQQSRQWLRVTPDLPRAAGSRPVGAHAPHEMFGDYNLTMLEDTGLVSRLAGALGDVAHNYQLTWPEFKRDPFGFMGRSIKGYSAMLGRFFGRRDAVLAIGIALFALGALVGILFLIDKTQSGVTSRVSLVAVGALAFAALLALFATWLGRDSGAAVMGARPADSSNVLSGIVVAFVLVFGVIGAYVLWSSLHARALAKAADQEELELTQMITDIPNEQPTPDEGAAGLAKGNGGGSKKEKIKPGGGGGGGREEQTPASFGKVPQASLTIPQVVAPDPHPPVIKNPALPMPATLDADPVLFPPDTRNLQYGDPKSKSTTPSSGPGTGNGIGSGTGGGIGPGSGGGYGPGEGGNTGGGPRREGGGGPGGGGGGGDYDRIFNGREVTSKARVLSKPEPTYTEAARKNQITGTVILRAVFSSSGSVTNIHAVSGLPDGLTERAIAAAKQIRFSPATKDGRPVSMWMQLEYNFNLY